ncbi:MAG: CPBP family intramembrane glutamic endopeptidase [Solirubrobacterales bacterium]
MRNRVFVERETCETAGDMGLKLSGSAEEGAIEPGGAAAAAAFPYSNWGPLFAVIGVVLALATAVVLSVPIVIVDHPANGELSTAANVAAQLAQELAFVMVPFVIAMQKGAGTAREAARRLGLRGFRSSALGWMLAAYGAYFVIAVAYVALFGAPKQQDIAEKLGPVAVQVVLIAVIVPICEETCFRGMVFAGLRERMPRIGAALLSGLIFGALHATTGISAVPPLIVLGVLLALLYEKTGSIVPCILLHMLNNSIALLAQ